jgi:hypothetical protein
LREQIVLISVLILLASVAQAAFGGQDASLDIIGSTANNTTIILPEGTFVGVDILGSSASNIQIGHSGGASSAICGIKTKDCGPCGEEKRYKTPWDDFTRPLCYPWSSYIPTRYNRQFIRGDYPYMGSMQEPLALGRERTYS